MKSSTLKRAAFLSLACGLLFQAGFAEAKLKWPAKQLLPSFPAPAPVQDLIQLHAIPQQWQAEASTTGHATGHLDGDGWLCQAGIDTPNAHMVYGPYDTSLPAGPNTAQYRIKIDNNTADDNPQVVVDVNDSTTGQVLATRTINRSEFTTTSDYVTFNVGFDVPAANHALEFRVYWLGGAYIKVDWTGVAAGAATDELYMFASLKGVVNFKKPRIFSYEGDDQAEGPTTWLESLGLQWTTVGNPWDLVTKYRKALKGVVVYDPMQPDTINLASTIALQHKALVASPSLAAKLGAAPYNLPILVDFRGRFDSKLAVYQALYDKYWPSLTHRVVIGQSPLFGKAAVREYGVALGAAMIWLDPRVAGESELLNKFLGEMEAGAVFMGWWQEEASGVERASEYGIATVASDWSVNLTVHSGMPRKIAVKPTPPKPPLQNKLYVAFIFSDGDNLQFDEHLLRKVWSNADRGKVPIGWTLSPAMVDAMPGALNYFYQSSTVNDNLISGPSGYGYTYPNSWTNPAALAAFVAKTNAYNKKAGFKVTTVWNTITGGISTAAGNAYAANAPDLLGLTAQNTGGGLTLYNNTLPGLALECNYCTDEGAMKNAISGASQNWDRNSPRFILIQAQPWTNITPTTFLAVANSLNADYAVVRPDTLFQLLREAHNLPWW